MKRIVAFVLCLIMAAVCMPVIAAPAEEAERGDITDYQQPITLGEAAGCADSAFSLNFENVVPDQPWMLFYDTDDSRYIAKAYVPDGGEFNSMMAAAYIGEAGHAAISLDYRLGTDENAFIEVSVEINGTSTVIFREYGEGAGYDAEWKRGFAEYNVPSDGVQVTIYVSYAGTVGYGKGGGAKDSIYGDPVKNLYIRNFYLQQGKDGALNAPAWAGHFNYSSETDFSINVVPFWDRVALGLVPNTENDGALVSGKAVVRAGDVLGFDVMTIHNGSVKSPLSFYVSKTDSFTDSDMVWTDNGVSTADEQSFHHVTYTFPTQGEYYVFWNIPNNVEGNYGFIDDFACTPRITLEEAASLDNEGFGEFDINREHIPAELATSWRSGWAPAYINNSLLVAKTDNSGAANSTATMTASNRQKAGDEIVFDYCVSSEANYDVFTFKVNGETVLEKSGNTSFNRFSCTIPADGVYTYEWSYRKDGSVNSGDDCVIIMNLVIPQMDLDHAASVEEDMPLSFRTFDGTDWRITMKNGEYVLASANHTHSSQGVLYMTANVNEGDIISFDYIKAAENNYDILTFYPGIEDDDADKIELKELTADWRTVSYTVTQTGSYMMMFIFKKDGSVSVGDDTAYIRNVRLESGLDLALNVEGGTLHFENNGLGKFVPYHESADRFCAKFVMGSDDAMVTCELEELVSGDTVSFDYKVEGSGGFSLTTGGWGVQWSGGSTNGQWKHVEYTLASVNCPASVDWYFSGDEGAVGYLDNVTITHTELIPITAVYVNGFEAPVAGDRVGLHTHLTLPDDRNYDFTEQAWYTADGELFVGEFVSGTAYAQGATLMAYVGYYFAEDCVFYVDGSAEDAYELSCVAEDGRYAIVMHKPVTCGSAGVLGDADGNGTVTANDALLLMRYALGLIPASALDLSVADVNGDGFVNANDALMVMRAALGLISL